MPNFGETIDYTIHLTLSTEGDDYLPEVNQIAKLLDRRLESPLVFRAGDVDMRIHIISLEAELADTE